MDVYKLNYSLPGGLDISLEDSDVWIDVKLNLFGGEDTLELFNLVSLLVLFVLLVSLVKLSKAELEVNVI